MKKIIKDFIPPIILKGLRKALTNKSDENSSRIFIDYNDALNLCTTNAYEEEELIDVIFLKTKRFSEKIQSEIIPIWGTTAYSLLSIINPVIENQSKNINVLDFGVLAVLIIFILEVLLIRN